MAEQVGTFDRLFISSDDSTYSALEFLPGSTLGATEDFLDTNGIRGTRQHSAARVRRARRSTGGQLRFAPSASELDLLLPWILGAAPSGQTFALAETVPARYFKTYRDGTKHKYDGLKVGQATFACAENGPLTLDVSVQGVDEATDGGATETGTITDDAGPYVLSDAALTVGGQSYNFRQIQITVNNFLEVKYNNSVTPSAIHATDLEVGVSLGMPFGDAGSALYGSALSGVAVVATFTNGSRSITFALAGVAAPKQPIPIGQRSARDLTWTGVARRTGTPTAPLIVTNDSTP